MPEGIVGVPGQIEEILNVLGEHISKRSIEDRLLSSPSSFLEENCVIAR